MRRVAIALALGLMLPTAAMAAPTKLSRAQLDQVTAGLSATVAATAEALGSATLARTKALTGSHEGRFVSIAWGRGAALAKGSDDAQTSVDVSGEGARVHTNSHTVSYNTPTGVVSRSWGFVFAIEINQDALAAVGAALR